MHNSIVEYLNETYEQYRYAHKLAKKSLSRARRKQEPLHPNVIKLRFLRRAIAGPSFIQAGVLFF